MRACSALLLILLSLTSHARAQTRPAGDPVISVITLGPGPLIYERYGHVGLRIDAPVFGVDVIYDWGNFSFDDPNFLGKFIKGDLRYWMEGKPADAFFSHYIDAEDRTVTERTLNLNHEQAMRVLQIIRDQDDEDHRYYLYDYYRDNCATRIRDAVDQATGGALAAAKGRVTPHDYRWHNRRLLRVGLDNVAIMTGMELLSGPRSDAPLSEWDDCYLPTPLGETLDRTTLADGRPLVRETHVLNTTKRPGNFEPTDALNPLWWTLPIGVCCGTMLLILASAWPLGFRLAATLWQLIVLAGAILMSTFALFTRHWVVAWDENFLQLTPLAILVLWELWRGSDGATERRSDEGEESRPTCFPSVAPSLRRSVAPLVCLSLSVLGGLVTISHLTPQHNAAVVCLTLPLHAAVFAGLRRLQKGWRHVPVEITPAADSASPRTAA